MLADPYFMLSWLMAGASLIPLLYLLAQKSSGPAQARLAELSRGGGGCPPATSHGPSRPRHASVASPRPSHRRGRSEERANRLRDRIVQAGIYRKNAVAVLMTVRLFLFTAMVGAGTLGATIMGWTLMMGLLAGTAAGLLATLTPSLWLDYVRRGRQTRIRRALPDALDLMSICLQGGMSLSSALSRVSQELGPAHPMLAVELSIVQREMQMGLSAGEAMRQFSRRFDLEELRSLASVIGQAERFGSSVTKALKTYAETLRTKRSQRAEEMAQKAAVKILFPTLLCIFPGIFIVVLGPAAIRIYQVLVQGAPWGNS